MATATNIDFAQAEAQSRAHSAALRKELGLRDMVFASILLVVIPDFFGTAVRAGPSHVFLWLLAILLFFIPQAFVVSHLNQRMPLEGGLYEWARLAFGDAIGFLVAWNLWLYVVLYVASIGLVTVTFVAYGLGSDPGSYAPSKTLVLAVSIVIIASLMFVAHLGLRIGKWVTNVGSAFTVLTIVVLVVASIAHAARGSFPGLSSLRLVRPPASLFSLNVFGKMTFGALCGFEYVAIFGGEARRPARHLTQAIAITAPLIALLYVLGTAAILLFVSPDSVDLIGPIPQALSLAVRNVPFARFVLPVSVLLLLTNYLASFSLNFTANTRLPMVAGWDHLLPDWFTHLHAKYRTPVHSILFLGAATVVASGGSLIGVGSQEAFAVLQTWGFTFYALAYVALFAIPLLAAKDTGLRAKWWLPCAACSGLSLTLLFVVLSVFPIIAVASQSTYTVKTVGVLVGGNALGVLLYCLGRARASA